MKKTLRVLPEVIFKYNFGKGVYPVRGIPKCVGISEEGKKWFALLRCRRVETKNSGIPMKGFHFVEEVFSLDRVVEGKESLEKYFEGLDQ